MKWSGYHEVNVVRRCREYVNVSITQKIHKGIHTPEGPYPRYEKVRRAIREKKKFQNVRVRLNGPTTVKNVSNK